MNEQNFIPGVPMEPEPDRLYAVLSQQQSGVAVGTILRGEDANWKAGNIIGHWPMPMTMAANVARALNRRGSFTFHNFTM
jgi:hypothetical protein